MKLKTFLLVLLIILAGCNTSSEIPQQELSPKNLDTLISCIGYSNKAYKALGALPNPSVQGNTFIYELPEAEGYFSGFNLGVVELDGIVQLMHFEVRERSITFNDLSIPATRQDIVNHFGHQGSAVLGNVIVDVDESVQFNDEEYVYIFHFKEGTADSVEVTTLEKYESYNKLDSETISGKKIDYNLTDLAIISNYAGKYVHNFRNYNFDCNAGENSYSFTVYGHLNNAQLLVGQRESQAYSLLELDMIRDSTINLTSIPNLTSEDILILKFRDSLGEDHILELEDKSNFLLYSEAYSTREKFLDNDQLIIDKTVVYDDIGNENIFVISIEDKDIDTACYLYLLDDKELVLISKEQIPNLSELNGIISNPRYHKGNIYYSVSRTDQVCSQGFNFKTTRINTSNLHKHIIFDGSISFILEEFDDPYQDYFIARRFLVNDYLVEMHYYLLTPEGNDLAHLGRYIEPIYLVEQIDEIMER
jgi:hypothetical protein